MQPYSASQRCSSTAHHNGAVLRCDPTHPPQANILTQYRHPREQYDTLGQHFRAFPSPGSTAEDPFVSRMRLFAHETTSEDPSVSRSRRSAHETTSEDPFVSRSRRLAHETTLADLSVSRSRRLAHETTLEDPSVSRMRLFAHEATSADPPVSRSRRFDHETTSEDPFVSRMRRLTHETTSDSELSCATGTLRALLDAAEVRPEPVGLVIGLSAFRNRHLDG